MTSGTTLDASGGTGDIGGNGGAVTLDGDGADVVPAAAHGIVVNNGSILVKGAATNGNGGTIIFDGIAATGVVIPVSGTVDFSASGAGTIGTFTGQ